MLNAKVKGDNLSIWDRHTREMDLDSYLKAKKKLFTYRTDLSLTGELRTIHVRHITIDSDFSAGRQRNRFKKGI